MSNGCSWREARHPIRHYGSQGGLTPHTIGLNSDVFHEKKRVELLHFSLFTETVMRYIYIGLYSLKKQRNICSPSLECLIYTHCVCLCIHVCMYVCIEYVCIEYVCIIILCT